MFINKTKRCEPAISRLWAKGESITLARMDQFKSNLGLVLCYSTNFIFKVTKLFYCISKLIKRRKETFAKGYFLK